METFELYGTAWLIYLSLGLILLAMVAYQTKNWHWNVKFALLSFLAVGAFTPDLVSGAQTYAPLVLTALLQAEVEGISAIINGLIHLVIIWGIVFFSSLAIRHFWKTRNKQAMVNE